jgi:hypothetical protein
MLRTYVPDHLKGTGSITGWEQPSGETPLTGPGWNLVGPARACPVPSDPRLFGPWWWWDESQQQYRPVDPGATLTPGRGYWVYAAADVRVRLE